MYSVIPSIFQPAPRRRWAASVCALGFTLGGVAHAQTELLGAGDLRLRHELQMLADAGFIRAPLGGWPLTASDLETAAEPEQPDLGDSLGRIAARRDAHGARWGLALGGVDTPFGLRGFENLPREEAELAGSVDWSGERVALGMDLSYVDDPQDGKEWRMDGSYVGAGIGNWFLAAGAVDRWWGPGWDGSLVLSNNARPIPAISIQRRRAHAPDLRGFRWVGPWTTQVLFGQLEEERDHPHAQLFGWRFGFKPLPRLEIGLSRAAQWCGSGRPCGLDTFIDLLTGQDNRGENVDEEDEPGNQLAGIDLRLAFALLGRPWALYGQRIGEDERDGRPSAWLTLGGLETWSQLGAGGGSYRLHLEYSDTACGHDNYGCAYNHSIYTDGYRYRGRAIGHSLDGDGLMASLGGLLITAAGHSWQVTVRNADINRGNDTRNSLAPRGQDLLGLELSHTRYIESGALSFGISREDAEFTDDGGDVSETRFFLRWYWTPPGAR